MPLTQPLPDKPLSSSPSPLRPLPSLLSLLSPDAESLRRCLFVIGLFLALLAPRLIYLYRVAPPVREAPYWDGREWASIGLNALQGKGMGAWTDDKFQMIRTPGYPLYISLVFFYSPVVRWEYLYMAHAATQAASDVILFSLIRAAFSPIAALAVVAWHSCLGNLRLDMNNAMSESFFFFLVAGSCWLFHRIARKQTCRQAVLLGAVLGYGALVRGNGMAHVAAFCLGLLVVPRIPLRRRLLLTVLMGAASVLVVLPWMARNKAVCGRFQLSSQQGMIGVQMEIDKPGARETQVYQEACARSPAENWARAMSQPAAFARSVVSSFGFTWNRRLFRLGLPFMIAMAAATAVLLWKRQEWGVYLLTAFGATLMTSLCSRCERFSWPYTWILAALVAGVACKAAARKSAVLRNWDDALRASTEFPDVPPWAVRAFAVVLAGALLGFAATLVSRNYFLDNRPALVRQPLTEADARQALKAPAGRPVLSAAGVREAVERETPLLPQTTGAPILITGEARFVEHGRVPFTYEEALAEWNRGAAILERRSKPGFGHVFEVAVNSHLKPHSRGEEIVYCVWPFEEPPQGLEDRAIVSVAGAVLPTRFDKEQTIRVQCAAFRRLDK